MENNEIMNNIEDVVELNDVSVVDEGNGIGLVEGALIVAGVVAAGVAVYKVAKWAGKKIKAKKEAKAAANECVDADYEECVEDVEA